MQGICRLRLKPSSMLHKGCSVVSTNAKQMLLIRHSIHKAGSPSSLPWHLPMHCMMRGERMKLTEKPIPSLQMLPMDSTAVLVCRKVGCTDSLARKMAMHCCDTRFRITLACKKVYAILHSCLRLINAAMFLHCWRASQRTQAMSLR